jgi:hypothetical protein
MRRIFDIPSALQTLRPGAEWVVRGDTYEGIEWLDQQQTQPTEQEINDEVVRLQAEYDALEYQRQRAVSYPSFAEQFDTLYHGGYDAWKASIDTVKSQFPKP